MQPKELLPPQLSADSLIRLTNSVVPYMMIEMDAIQKL